MVTKYSYYSIVSILNKKKKFFWHRSKNWGKKICFNIFAVLQNKKTYYQVGN